MTPRAQTVKDLKAAGYTEIIHGGKHDRFKESSDRKMHNSKTARLQRKRPQVHTQGTQTKRKRGEIILSAR